LVDLDELFLARIGNIGAFIRDQGYPAYKSANSSLALALAEAARDPTILVTSSGFLANDNPPDTLATNRALLASGHVVSMLPACEMAAAVGIIVSRQMARPFNSGIARERATAQERFATYKDAGDLLVCSAAEPDAIAAELASYLTGDLAAER